MTGSGHRTAMRLVFAAAIGLAGSAALPSVAAPTDPLKLPGTPPRPGPQSPAAQAAASPATGSPPPASPASAAPVPLTEAQKYCQNIAAAAADARFAWQAKKLGELEGQIATRTGELEAKQAEVKAVLDRYDDAMRRAKATLVDIYAKMKPETAATQLSMLDDEAAAAILSQLTPQKASAILNEISPDRAAKIVTTISGLVPPPQAGMPSATPSSAERKS